MEKESYRILKEINSLYLKQCELDLLNSQEELRLEKIQTMRSDREQVMNGEIETLNQVNKDFCNIENSLAKLSSQKEQSQANIKNVFSENEVLSLDKQILILDEKISEEEANGLELMDQAEELETSINEAKTFLLGSESTMSELAMEIKELNQPRLEEIEVLKSRQMALHNELPKHTSDNYLKLLIKNLKYGPLTSVEKGHCRICGMAIPKLEENQIEKNLLFKQCTSCSRIFVPISCGY